MTAADRVIKWSTGGARVRRGRGGRGGVVRARLRPGPRAWGRRGTARLIPLTVDGLIWASSIVLLDSARRGAGAVPRAKRQCVPTVTSRQGNHGVSGRANRLTPCGPYGTEQQGRADAAHTISLDA